MKQVNELTSFVTGRKCLYKLNKYQFLYKEVVAEILQLISLNK